MGHDGCARRLPESGHHIHYAGRNAPSASQPASFNMVSGVCSAGFNTQVQPAASAGASFHAAIPMG